jgi:hypothetical protein
MKAEPKIDSLQDRPATWEEVRRATSSTPTRALELCYSQGKYCDVDSDLGGVIRYPVEEFEFFAYLSEMEETLSN